MGLRLKYFAGEAVATLKRNPFMTIAAISPVAVSLFLLGGVVVRSQIIGRAGVDSVTFGGDAVKKLLRINALLRTISLVMTILLLTAATVLIANTIRLAIYARRREIGVMKLVGATNWFIRVPFIFEGVVEAVAGAIVAAAVIWLAKFLWLDRLQQFMAFLPLGITAATVTRMFVVLVVVGMSVGALGSTLALRRFLEV